MYSMIPRVSVAFYTQQSWSHQKYTQQKADLDYKFCIATMTMLCVALIRLQLVTVVLAALAWQSTNAFTLFPVVNRRSLQSPENLLTV
jgi:hypothetical protein